MPNQIVKDLEHIAANTAAKAGFKIIGLHLIAKTNPMTIQLQIRHQDGADVSLEDCSQLSHPIGDCIEDAKIINGAYVLEISSPGLSDILETDKDFDTFKGFPIEVSTKNTGDKPLLHSGLLHTRSKDHLLINIKGRMSKIPRENVIQVKLTSPTG